MTAGMSVVCVFEHIHLGLSIACVGCLARGAAFNHTM